MEEKGCVADKCNCYTVILVVGNTYKFCEFIWLQRSLYEAVISRSSTLAPLGSQLNNFSERQQDCISNLRCQTRIRRHQQRTWKTAPSTCLILHFHSQISGEHFKTQRCNSTEQVRLMTNAAFGYNFHVYMQVPQYAIRRYKYKKAWTKPIAVDHLWPHLKGAIISYKLAC